MIPLLPRPRTLVAPTLSIAEIEHLLDQTTHLGPVYAGRFPPPEYFANLFESADTHQPRTVRPIGSGARLIPFVRLELSGTEPEPRVTFSVRRRPYLDLAIGAYLTFVTIIGAAALGGHVNATMSDAGVRSCLIVLGVATVAAPVMIILFSHYAMERTEVLLRRLLRRANLEAENLERLVRKRRSA